MNKVNLFLALTALFSAPIPHIFLLKLSITDEVALVANCSKIYLAKGAANFKCPSLPNLPIVLPRNPPD